MVNSIISGTSAFYLPNQASEQDNAYFYKVFKQALELGYGSDEALMIARKQINEFRQQKKNKRKVEDNKELDNNTQRRK